jgi:hypothetical protein
MRPVNRTYTPTTLNASGFALNVTGAVWALTANTVGDGVAHQVTIKNNSATDHSAKTAVITGNNADGATQTETINLPAGTATTTSALYFLTVTSVVPSATIGADTMNLGWNNLIATPMVVCDPYRQSAPRLTVEVTGTINFTGQECYDDPFVQGVVPAWFTITALSGKTANTSTDADGGITGFRVITASFTAGATLKVGVLTRR